MKTVQTEEEVIQEITNSGGIGLIPLPDGGIRIAIGIDPKNPQKAFDDINAFETSLCRVAKNDPAKVKEYSNLSDELRRNVIERMRHQGMKPEEFSNFPTHL